MPTHGLTSLRMSFWVFVKNLKCGPGFDFTLFFPGFEFWDLILSSTQCPSVSVLLLLVILSKLVFSCASSFSYYFLSVGSMWACVSVYNFYLVLCPQFTPQCVLLICLSLLVLLYIHSSLRYDGFVTRLLRNVHIFYYYNYQCLINIQNLIHLFRTETTWMCSVSLTAKHHYISSSEEDSHMVPSQLKQNK